MAYTSQNTPSKALDPTTLPPLDLPAGVTSRFVDTSPDGLVFHCLESIPSNSSKITQPKLVLCVHGFPELAYSWRKMLPLLSAQGYHAVAFDQRGYGRTFSRKPLQQSDFRPLNLIRDIIVLVQALGYHKIHCLVGHDFGAVAANLLTLARPDIVNSLVLMSHPTKGPPALPFNTQPNPSLSGPSPPPAQKPDVHGALATLDRPRKHYKWYYITSPANDEMTNPTGNPLHTFLRGYFHLKSADWDGNTPHKLPSWSADQLALLPRYYVMDLSDTMRQAVERDMSTEPPQRVAKRSARWLPDNELAVYASEWARTTFQGGLNWYRTQTTPEMFAEMQTWSGVQISCPMKFVSGKKDWGTYQEPGALEAMEEGRSVKASAYRGTVLVDGAGHWVNQEQPERCVQEIVDLIGQAEREEKKNQSFGDMRDEIGL
jgi:pimeloyl-ACP methyl ester carboxylesterase